MAASRLRLEGKVALVTGASRGIGKAIALAFAGEGAAVAVNYAANRRLAEEVCEAIASAGGRALCVQADVGVAEQVDSMVRQVVEEYGRIDVLVNNAGLLNQEPSLEATGEGFDRMVDVNIKGVIRCAAAVAEGMKQRGRGRIINVSSIAALGTSMPGVTGYAMTKAAVNMFNRRLARELGSHNITVNAIAPGFILTDMSREGARASGTYVDGIADRTMLRRVGEPSDIAGVALFLASDDSSFMTGQVLTVDGGRIDYLTHSV
ncbi:MAG: 3-oxoacyl-ACP reductase FabG [Acidobacteria bacterium]|nr:3-oxoacyl-ACP reductase FabG [Acidobacteriota bacterium]